MALPILIVDHVQYRLGDNQTVAGAEALGHVLREVQPAFQDHHGIGADLLGLCQTFHDKLGVGLSVLQHFISEVRALVELSQLVLVGVLVDLAEVEARRQLGDRVGQRALLSIGARGLGELQLKSGARCARKPAMGAAGGQDRMVSHSQPPAFPSGPGSPPP